MRLLEFFQKDLWISRRAFTKMVDTGEVLLGGERVEQYKQEAQAGQKLEYLEDGVKIFKIINIKKSSNHIVLFHKPMDLVVSKEDPFNRTIFDVMPGKFKKKYLPIGRLDKNSRGLLLLTDEPKLVHQMTHPRFEIKKTYLVWVKHALSANQLQKLRDGVVYEDITYKTNAVQKISELWKNDIKSVVIYDKLLYEDLIYYMVVLSEGKKRHIRMSWRSFGVRVEDILRIAEWEYQLGEIKEWKWEST